MPISSYYQNSCEVFQDNFLLVKFFFPSLSNNSNFFFNYPSMFDSYMMIFGLRVPGLTSSWISYSHIHPIIFSFSPFPLARKYDYASGDSNRAEIEAKKVLYIFSLSRSPLARLPFAFPSYSCETIFLIEESE